MKNLIYALTATFLAQFSFAADGLRNRYDQAPFSDFELKLEKIETQAFPEKQDGFVVGFKLDYYNSNYTGGSFRCYRNRSTGQFEKYLLGFVTVENLARKGTWIGPAAHQILVTEGASEICNRILEASVLVNKAHPNEEHVTAQEPIKPLILKIRAAGAKIIM